MVRHHPSTQRFVTASINLVTEAMKSHNGNIERLFNDKVFNKQMKEVGRPHFDTFIDNANGLGIAIHDTWSNSIDVKNYQIKNNIASGTMVVTIYDNFGLDSDDIFKNSAVKSPLFPQNREIPGFADWYVLQHYAGLKGQFQPFVTVMPIEVDFSVELN